MTDQKGGPGKSGDPSATDAAAGKRPHATIDLKAVEVPTAAGRPASTAAGAATGMPRAPAPASPADQSEAARKVAAASADLAQRKGASASGTRPAPQSAGAGAAKPGVTTTAAAAAKPAAPTVGAAPPTATAAIKGRSRLGHLLTHTLAGLVGGALALYGAPHLTSLLRDAGLPSPAPMALPADVQARIADLERGLAAVPKADPAKALSVAEAATRRLEEVTTQLRGLSETQSRVVKQTLDIENRLAKDPPIAETADRLIKLEAQLALLSAAAKSEPASAGRIAQLAAITGRMADLERALASTSAGVRKDVTAEIETRIAPSAEASEAAKAASQRIESVVGAVKSEQNRLAAGLDQLKTGTERLQLALKATQDDTASLGASLDGLRRDVDSRLKATAKPADVSQAVAPVASRLASLEKNVTTVVNSEAERRATAERIVLALELGNLKRAMDRGAPYAGELGEVAKVSGGAIDLTVLDRYRNEGVPALPELTRAFRPVVNDIIDADSDKTDSSVLDRLMSGARSFVRIRKTSHGASDTSAEAIVARMEAALKAGRFAEVLAEAKALPQVPPSAKTWLAKVEARQAVEQALAKMDTALKSSLGAGPAPAAQK